MKSARVYQARKQQAMNKVAEVKPVAVEIGKKVEEKIEEVKTAVKDTAVKAAEAAVTLKEDAVTEVYVQFGGQEAGVDSIVKQAKAAYVAAGNDRGSIKSVKVYMKPEDGTAYYVINDTVSGQVDLF